MSTTNTNDHGTLSDIKVNSNNSLFDKDELGTPETTNNSSLTQTVMVNAINGDVALATAGDGIEDINHAISTGDDLSIDASSYASSTGKGYAQGFNQSVKTGGNQQANEVTGEITGGDASIIEAGGDSSSYGAAQGSSTGPQLTDSVLDGNMTNMLQDQDSVSQASTINNSNVSQTLRVNGGHATAGHGIVSEDNWQATGGGSVGDDLSIKGSTAAQADAIAVARSFNQSIKTGGNEQKNSSDYTLVGEDVDTVSAGGSGAAIDSNSSLLPLDQVTLTNSQYNMLRDQEKGDNKVDNPEVTNNAEVKQSVIAESGEASAQDGIHNWGKIGSTVEDGGDSTISGTSAASANATAFAASMNQELVSGDNKQVNTGQATIVGGNLNSVDVGENGADMQVPALSVGATGTLSLVGEVQRNWANDKDHISNANIENNDSLNQYVKAVSGNASSGTGITGIENSWSNTDQGGLGSAHVGDDSSITGSTSANANATAIASSFNQTINTGGNGQQNSSNLSLTGGDHTTVHAGENHADLGGSTTVGMNATGSMVINKQLNTLKENDAITGPDVYNAVGATATQTAVAEGKTATAGSGIDQAKVASQTMQRTIDGDSTYAGEASANANAVASATSFSQNISSGGNIQVNALESEITAGNYSSAIADENDASNGQAAASSVTMDAGALTLEGAMQENVLGDEDVICTPETINDGTVTQKAIATGGTATSHEGISSDAVKTHFAEDNVGDDAVIKGSTQASANAEAAASTMNQMTNTAGNKQSNSSDIDITGGNNDVVATGEDDHTPNNMGANGVSVSLGTPVTTGVCINQQNELNDSDDVNYARVVNEGSVTQVVQADGGTAKSGAGIDIDSFNGTKHVVDDSSIDALSSASADAVAKASAFNQSIATGANIQVNKTSLEVVGNNEASVLIGEDTQGTSTLAAGLSAGNVDSTLAASQSNWLMDNDDIYKPVVRNEATLNQVAKANGKDATADNGIQDVWGSKFITPENSVGDDYAITAKTIASADATANVSAFNQTLATGGNAQVNTAKADVIGHNDTYLFSGEDDSLSPQALSVTPSSDLSASTMGMPEVTDTTFSIEQVNSLHDQDIITNPTVVNNGSLVQSVSAVGGEAIAHDGIHDAEGIMNYQVGDDMSIDASTAATADALGVANAFNQTIVMGANVQANTVDVSVVGGSSTVNVIGEDDLA
ncbi:beta strand repeat-containing protein [Polycladidibacter stylochi]|uniref:beta strand repeat-containing protein n=1 Tax=Polycladidibacter stylochi TaxID=1807766 RepID=UPI0008333033|nr:hypothetical protein [Pseudovibrio stylochi]